MFEGCWQGTPKVRWQRAATDVLADDRAVPQDMFHGGRRVPAVHAPAIRFGNLRQVSLGPSPASDDVLEYIGCLVVKL